MLDNIKNSFVQLFKKKNTYISWIVVSYRLKVSPLI